MIMKKVFLLGDSIRLDYCDFVKDMLKDEAEVCYSPDNGRFTDYTYVSLPGWKTLAGDPNEVSVVHWNNGLWDALHVLGEDAQTPVPEYAETLRRIARRLKKVFPNARIVFALTTFVIEERMNPLFYRRNAEIERYNAAARAVMAEEGVLIDDLYAVARDMSADWHAQDGTHFTEEGYRALARAVAGCLSAL